MSQTDRYWTTPTGWWWLAGANSSDIASRVSAGFRPFSLERTPTGAYNTLFVQNSGAYAKAGTTLYYGQTGSSLDTSLNNNNQRLLDLHVYDAGRGVTNMTAIAIPNSGADASGWGWLYNTTPTAISNWLSAANPPLRLIDLDVYNIGATQYYSAVAVQNTGTQALPWWWQVNVPPAALSSFIGANNARLTQLVVSTAPTLANPTPSFSAILVGGQSGHWWWYYNQTLADVAAHADQNGARVTDLKQYADAQGNTLYACIMADNTNAITQRVRQLFWNALPNGDFGLYLKQVGGPVLANLNENFTFEPASMIKILHGTYAVAQCASNADSLDNTLFNDDTCHPGECPDLVGCNSSTESLAAVLRRMFQASDNNATKEIADRYGVSSLNDFALSLGLTSTQLNHTLGCLCGNPNNHFSLSNAGTLYEDVANGSIFDSSWKDILFGLSISTDPLMSSGSGNTAGTLYNIITQESAGLHLSASELETFRIYVRWAYKPGAYTCTYTTTTAHRTQGGWARIPFMDSAGNMTQREYVLGTFVNNCTDTAAAGVAYTAYWELLREQIRAALVSWDSVVPANDLCSNAANIPGWAGTWTSPLYDTQYATTSDCELASTCGAASNGHSVFFSYTPSVSGLFSVDTMGSDYDTVLSVHNGCSTTAGATCVQPATFACNDDLPGGPLTSGIFNLSVTAGQHYLIKVAAYGSSGASYLMLHTSLTEQSPCNADYNNDGSTDLSDVFDLSNDIAAGTQSFPPSSPDFNNDGSADLSDVMDISNVVAGGPCP